MRRIRTSADLEEGLDALCRIDPRLIAVREAAGSLPLRLIEPGFASLASVVVSQQVSRRSAEAIFGRLARLLEPLTPQAVLAADHGVFREAGLSRPKVRTLLAAAAAVDSGVDLRGLCDLEASAAVAELTAIPGVGAWTAECYLLFAAGHPDVFPARDVALQTAAGHAFSVAPRPGDRQLAALAVSWAPWRGVAARLLWGYYAVLRGWTVAAPL